MNPHGQRGSAIVLALLMMTVLMLVGAAFLTVSLTESMIVANQISSARAFNLAEAGLAHAKTQLASADLEAVIQGDGTLLAAQGLGNGAYSVALRNNPGDAGGPTTDTDGLFVLAATGTYRNASRTVEMLVEANDAHWGEWAVYGLDHVTLLGSADVIGDAGTNGDMWLGATIHGNATVGGTINRPGNVTGTVTTGAEDVEFANYSCPSIPYGPSPIGPGVNFNTLTGTLTISGDDDVYMPAGDYYFRHISKTGNGNLVIANGSTVNIYVTHWIDFKGGIDNPNESALNLKFIGCVENMAFGSHEWRFELNTTSWLLTYSPSYLLRLLGSGERHGTFIGKKIIIGGTGLVYFDGQVSSGSASGVSFVRGTWNERSY